MKRMTINIREGTTCLCKCFELKILITQSLKFAHSATCGSFKVPTLLIAFLAASSGIKRRIVEFKTE